MLSFLATKLGRMFASVLAVAMLAAAIFLAGRKDHAAEIELQAATDALATHERIADAPLNSTRSDAVERLHSSGQLRD